jgi:queuine tRNA-ribosyltransferase
VSTDSVIKTSHGNIELPAFMPDATYGSIRAISFEDAKNAGVKEIVTTTLHLEQKIGSQYIKQMRGVHKFFGWDRPILTDSGGWQVFSLINSKKGNTKNLLSEVGCSFIDPDTGKHSLLTPESSQVIQHNLGADIVTVLDNPILGNASLTDRKESIRINTIWAKRAKAKFTDINKTTTSLHPLLGCVIQGGNDFELRKVSAEELVELDFDLYNYGGMPLKSEETWKTKSQQGFYHEMLEYVVNLIPKEKIKYAMGVGQPEDIAFCVDIGWQLFDTVLPTRNARHGYIYVNEGQGDLTRGYKDLNYDILHLRSERYKFDDKPLDGNCKCEACKNYSRAYLRHLIRIQEPAGLRLTTLHNLQFYSDWMRKLTKFQ